MLLIDTPLYLKVKKSYEITNGMVYFFDNYYVTEMNAGIVVDYKNSKDLIDLVGKHFPDDTPFGVISNRINSYSIDLLDSDKFKEKHKNAVGKAIVSYSDVTTKFVNLENYFCEFNRKVFNNLNTAEHWIEEQFISMEEVS